MKYILILLLSLTVATTVSARGETAKYKDKTAINKDYDIYITNAVATPDYTKFKIVINNKSSNTLVLKTQDIIFVINGQEYKPTSERILTIGPNREEYKIVDLKGAGFIVDKYAVKVSCLYKVRTDSKALSVPDFKLPASANDFTAGDFKCKLIKQVRRTDVTEVSFDCVYTGEKVGMINPYKGSLKMPNGRIYANMHNGRQLILYKGESYRIDFVWKRIPVSDGDMQFVDMYIQFGETFAEAKLDKLPDAVLEMERDMTGR